MATPTPPPPAPAETVESGAPISAPSELSLWMSLALGVAFASLGIAIVYIVMLAPPLVGMDDANIGFRYARNLAEGYGFVFNPGGERVEGVTSLLWVFLLAALHRVFGPAWIEPGGIALSVLFTGVALAVVLRMLARFPGSGRWAGIVWLASIPAFYQWSGLALMDVALWSAALHVFLALCLRAVRGVDSRAWPLVLGAIGLVLARPDSMLVLPATVLLLVITFGTGAPVRRTAITVLAAGIPAILGLTLVRLAYFGYPLPNTYYTKVSPDLSYRIAEGLRYVGGYFADHPVSVVPAALTLGLAVDALRRWSAQEDDGERSSAARELHHLALAAGLFVAIGFVSAIVVGGDHFFDHRFLQPYLPLLAVPLALGVSRGAAHVGSGGSKALTILAVLLAGVFIVREWRAPYRSDIGISGYDMALEGRVIGEVLGTVLGDDAPVLGVWQAGGVGYAYRGPVRDLLGLNWVAMGHSPGDRKGVRDHAAFHEGTFWSDPPDLMIPLSLSVVESVGCPRRIWENVLRGVMATPRFVSAFEPVVVRAPDVDAIFAYGRTAWLDERQSPVVRLGWEACGVQR